MACWFSRRTLNQRLSIHPINTTYPLKSKQQASAKHVVFILESELAITYSDWRASIRYFKTLCNWCLSADCLWICSAQINTAQLYVCNAVIVMQCCGGKVRETLWFLYFSVCFALLGTSALRLLLNCTCLLNVLCTMYTAHEIIWVQNLLVKHSRISTKNFLFYQSMFFIWKNLDLIVRTICFSWSVAIDNDNNDYFHDEVNLSIVFSLHFLFQANAKPLVKITSQLQQCRFLYFLFRCIFYIVYYVSTESMHAFTACCFVALPL